MRRRGIVVLNEEDLFRLLHLNEGERVVGVHADFRRDAVLIAIDGGTVIPESAEGTESPIIHRPMAMAVVRQDLIELYAARHQGDYADPEGAERFADRVAETIWSGVFPDAG